MKLVHLHGVKTHMGCEVKHAGTTKWAPLCQPRVWQSVGLFKGGLQVIDPFDGDESQIDCKRCLTKMGKHETCPSDDPKISELEAQHKACKKRQLSVSRSIDALQREREELIYLERKLIAELNQKDDEFYAAKNKKKEEKKD